MSVIVNFPLHRVEPATRQRFGAIAEIVIFPGVRIERQETPAVSRGIAARARGAAPAAAQDIESF